MALEWLCGADFWCNRHCRTTPVLLEGFWGQVWPKIGRKLEKSEYRVANESLSFRYPAKIKSIGKQKKTSDLDRNSRTPALTETPNKRDPQSRPISSGIVPSGTQPNQSHWKTKENKRPRQKLQGPRADPGARPGHSG